MIQPDDNAGTLSVVEDGAARRGATSALLVLVLECDHPTRPSARHALGDVEAVVLARGAERACWRRLADHRRTLEVQVADRRMSSVHARLTRLAGRWVVEDAGSKNGTRVNGEPVAHAVLADGDVLEVGHTLFLFRAEAELDAGAPADLDAGRLAPPALGLVTLVPELARRLEALAEVARSEVPLVLLGESGTGKEVVARAVHGLAGRTGSFVAVNCGALPANLVETELFGYRKGAFSGAVDDRPGLIRSVDQGTLFLDEVGDLPGPAQAPLLRVLQEREVHPVGATRPVPVDLRVIAATHRDLPALAERGEFRHDLWARLSGFTFELPPLRERREDLGLLVAALLARGAPAGAGAVTFTARAGRALLAYDWPLNVRELAQCLASARVLARGAPIALEHLPVAVAAAAPRAAPGASAPSLSDDERELRDRLVELLREHDGNLAAVARAMGKARMQIHRWVKRYGLAPDAFRR